MFCPIWYHLYNSKNVKNTNEGVLLLLKVTLPHGCFLCFLNCTNGTNEAKHHMCFFFSDIKSIFLHKFTI